MLTVTVDVHRATSLNGKNIEGGVHIVTEAEGNALIKAGKATLVIGPDLPERNVDVVIPNSEAERPLTAADILRIRAEARKSAKQPAKAAPKNPTTEAKSD